MQWLFRRKRRLLLVKIINISEKALFRLRFFFCFFSFCLVGAWDGVFGGASFFRQKVLLSGCSASPLPCVCFFRSPGVLLVLCGRASVPAFPALLSVARFPRSEKTAIFRPACFCPYRDAVARMMCSRMGRFSFKRGFSSFFGLQIDCSWLAACAKCQNAICAWQTSPYLLSVGCFEGRNLKNRTSIYRKKLARLPYFALFCTPD